MSLEVRAIRPDERVALQKFRHRCYVELGGFLPPQPGGRVQDRFDTLDTTENLVAFDGRRMVGAVRLTETGPSRTSAEDYFDFRQALAGARRTASGSMLCVDPTVQASAVCRVLMGTFYLRALQRGVDRIYGVVNPAFWPRCKGIGAKALSEPRKAHGLDFVPFVMDMSWMNKRFRAFCDVQGAACDAPDAVRAFYEPGEVLVGRGDAVVRTGTIVEGSVVAVGATGAAWRLGPGDRLGRLEQLNGLHHQATLTAEDRVSVAWTPRAAAAPEAVRLARAS